MWETRASLQVDVKPNVSAAAATTVGDKKRNRAARAAAREKAVQYINRTIENSDSDYEMDEDLVCEEHQEEMEMNMGVPRDHIFIKKIKDLLLIFTPCLEVSEPATKRMHTTVPPLSSAMLGY